MKVRKNYDVDADELLAAISDGKVTVESLMAIAKFSATDLQKIGLGHCTTEGKPTEFLELRASSEFKAKVDEIFEDVESAPAPAAKPKKAAKKKTEKESSVEKAKKALAKVKGKKSAQSDLDSILED